MSADLHEIYPTIVTIKDFPCGSGKTTKMIQKLGSDKLYLIIVPLQRVSFRGLSLGLIFHHLMSSTIGMRYTQREVWSGALSLTKLSLLETASG